MFSATISPSKGKGKDGVAPAAWKPGWWDYWPLVESPRRPLQWSSSSILITTHPTRPLLIGRHISTSKEFAFPPSPAIATHTGPPNAWEGATVILVHPSEDWVFAFFPSRHGGGIGCAWQRVGAMNTWLVKGEYPFGPGDAVVGGQWLGGSRTWGKATNGVPYRLPPLGPRIPAGRGIPPLFLVTETYQVHLRAWDRWSKHSLLRPTTGKQGQEVPSSPGVDDVPIKSCIGASVGLYYSDDSVYVAVRSRRAPRPTQSLSTLSDPRHLGYESEVTVHQVTVQVKHISIVKPPDLPKDHATIVISSRNLRTIDDIKGHLSHMVFLSYPPQLDSAISHVHLVLGTLEIEEFDTSPVKSVLQTYSIPPAPRTSSPTAQTSMVEAPVSRTFDGAVSFIFPVSERTPSSNHLVFVGVVDPSSTVSKSYTRKKEMVIGMTKVLNVSDLSDNLEWESTPLWSSTKRFAVPVSSATSPNQKQVWTASATGWMSPTTLHSLPRPHHAQGKDRPEALDLALSILSQRSTADILHSISMSSLSSGDVLDIIQTTQKIIQECKHFPPAKFDLQVVGIALALYRTRAKRCKDEEEQNNLNARWKTAQDLASIAACRVAFDQCNDGTSGSYDSFGIWPLLKMSLWIVDLCKSIAKACVRYGNLANADPQTDNDDLFGSTPSSPVGKEDVDPILLHLIHPLSLSNLAMIFRHIQRLRTFLDRAPTSQTPEHLNPARNILVDLIDNNSFNFVELNKLFEEAHAEAIKLDSALLNEVLASCQPTLATREHLQNTVAKIVESETFLDRAHLFIGPEDLLDGVSRLTLGPKPKPNEVDVITKESALSRRSRPTRVCLRCGGRFKPSIDTLPAGPKNLFYSRYYFWEKIWHERCSCGEMWERTK